MLCEKYREALHHMMQQISFSVPKTDEKGNTVYETKDGVITIIVDEKRAVK